MTESELPRLQIIPDPCQSSKNCSQDGSDSENRSASGSKEAGAELQEVGSGAGLISGLLASKGTKKNIWSSNEPLERARPNPLPRFFAR